MKTATHGAAAFGSDLKDLGDAKGKAADGVQSKKESSNEDGNHSDKGEEDEEEGVAKKAVRGLSTRGVDDEEDGGKEDFDLEDEIEIGMLIKYYHSYLLTFWISRIFMQYRTC